MDATQTMPTTALRVVVLFDGNNWYKAMREYLRPELGRTDYPTLVNWLVEKLREVRGLPRDALVRAETWYITAVPGDSAGFRENILGFLLSIERQGIRVERLTTRPFMPAYSFICSECSEQVIVDKISYECPKCTETATAGQVIRYEEEQVDVTIAVKLVELSILGEIDVAVLVSGDSDYIPALAAARRHGVSVYVASLPLRSTSHELEHAADGRIDMAEGLRLSMRAPVGNVVNGGGEPSGTT